MREALRVFDGGSGIYLYFGVWPGFTVRRGLWASLNRYLALRLLALHLYGPHPTRNGSTLASHALLAMGAVGANALMEHITLICPCCFSTTQISGIRVESSTDACMEFKLCTAFTNEMLGLSCTCCFNVFPRGWQWGTDAALD